MSVEVALILIGSPRGLERSHSARLARELVLPFSSDEWELAWVHAHAAARREEERERLLRLVDRAALILLVSPLYVDSLPAPTIAALQAIAAHRSSLSTRPHARFAALLHCGFPEAEHNLTCRRICERFASEAGFEWAGGLMLGGGGMTNRRIIDGLRTAGGSLALDLPIPALAQEILQKPVMPRWLYRLGGNVMWGREAKKLGVSRDELRARPYEHEQTP